MENIRKSAYFVLASVGIHRNLLYQNECLLHTGAQRNLIAKDFLSEQWTAHRQAAENVHLRSASKDAVDVSEKINLHVHVGDSLPEEIFHIVDKLAVNILPATSFIDENILGILP